MQENKQPIFQNLTQLEPPQGLLGGIVLRIMRERRRYARVRVGVLVWSTLVSCAGLVPAVRYAGEELSGSGFYQYLSLLFSDGGVLLVSWKEFLLSLAETIPLMGITLVLATVFILLGSLRLMVRDMKLASLFGSIQIMR